MARCPCCNARLSGESRCPRCSAELGQIIRCEHLAKRWLTASVQLQCEQKTELAIEALNRSLRYQQTPLALLFRGFMMRLQNQSGAEVISPVGTGSPDSGTPAETSGPATEQAAEINNFAPPIQIVPKAGLPILWKAM